VNAAFMLLKQHERGIHTIHRGTSGAKVTEVRFQSRATPSRAEPASRNLRLFKYVTKS
jgi:hypothetical protein